MGSQAQKLEKMQLRQSYRNVWHTDLMSTIQADTPYCCFSLFCGPCVSYLLRERALYNDMSRYTCCGGYVPCSGRCGERRCPEFCLCLEVFLCFGNSVASTRFMLQDEFNIQTTQCDNCIIGFMLCVQQIACIFSIVALIVGSDEIEEASQILSCLADYVYCTVCACMQTQHKVEMDKRDGKFGPQPAMAVPPVQQMSRMNQPIPPSVGYAPPTAYGQPYGYPPAQQPHSHGYPPAQQPPSYGYPPAPPSPPSHGYPPPPPSHGYPPPPPHGYQPAEQPQSHGYPPQQPHSALHGYPPPQQLPSHGYPPAQQPHSQGYPPAQAQ